jgi:hypothetical protein
MSNPPRTPVWIEPQIPDTRIQAAGRPELAA